MPRRSTRPVLATLSCVLLVLGGCLSTSPTRFYTLPILTDVPSPAATGAHALTIGVGPVDPAALSGPTADCHPDQSGATPPGGV